MPMGDDLLAILKEAREIRQEQLNEPLIDCPVCGEVLDENSRGEKNCPMGHYRAPGGVTKGSAGVA